MGASSGGMTALEWPLCTPKEYIGSVTAITTAAAWNPWAMGNTEALRQIIMSDQAWKEGWYDPTPDGQPAAGMAAARMVAMLSYKNVASYEKRFGRSRAGKVAVGVEESSKQCKGACNLRGRDGKDKLACRPPYHNSASAPLLAVSRVEVQSALRC